MSQPPEGPDFSLADVAREGLIERPGAEPSPHDGTGRVDLSFTVHRLAEDGAAQPPAQRGVRVPPGVTVFDAASWNGIAIDSTCGGHGTCHKCKVQITSGVEVPITRHDARTFTATQLSDGWRLGCLVHATRDLTIEVPPLTTRPKAATVGIGRQVILRGVNYNALGDYYIDQPQYPAPILPKPGDFPQMAALGMNSVRLLLSWSKVEPQPGVYDEDYLAQVRSLAARKDVSGRTLAQRHAFALRLARYEAELNAIAMLVQRVASMEEDHSPAAHAMGSMLKIRGTELQQAMSTFLVEALGDYVQRLASPAPTLQ